jgi:hypothetical protein
MSIELTANPQNVFALLAAKEASQQKALRRRTETSKLLVNALTGKVKYWEPSYR